MATTKADLQAQTSKPSSHTLSILSQAQLTFILVDLNSLPTAQLNNVKNQLTQELQHLTTSFSQLKQAQVKFRDCGNSVRDGLQKGEGWLLHFCVCEEFWGRKSSGV